MPSSSSSPQQHPSTILLLKTKSSPHDGYDEFFSASTKQKPTFIPVLSHNFHHQNLNQIKALLESGNLNPGPGRRYGGLIFTSQRAVEAFADLVRGVDGSLLESSSHDLPLYTVGPATARSLTSLRDAHLPHATIHGAEMGNGQALAGYILDHYNGLFQESQSQSQSQSQSGVQDRGKPPLLFLVGETRRDIIPKTLMGESTPEERRIGVEEVVVYETGVVEGFEAAFEDILGRQLHQLDTDEGGVVWVVVFSPTGCDAMARVLEREIERAGKGGGRRRVFVATIGPTTRDHLLSQCGFQPDVCAAKPSPEGVGAGIEEFMVELGG
ncbi:tetrapyrrole biosynthesis, uroporphyrinogen III synthase [Aspergillus varians]